MRALAERQRVELVERAEELAQLGAGHRRGIDRLVLGPSSRRSLTTSTSTCPDATIDLDGLEQVRPVELRHPGDAQDLERIEPPRTGGHHPDQRDVVVRVGDRPERLLEVADLGRVEQATGRRRRCTGCPRRAAAPRSPRGACACGTGRRRRSSVRPVPSPTIDLIASTIATASSSGAGADDELDRGRRRVGRSSGACRARSGSRCCAISRLAAVRTLRDGAEVLLDPEARRRAGRRGRRVVGGRPREPRVELGEGREAGAPEAVDRLVVVADDHDVVGPVGRPAEQLDELDLGDVGVLELVDEDVAELALPAAQDVRAGLEQRRDGGDLLAEVEGAAPRELGLVGAVDRGQLGQAQDLERGAVDDVGRRQGVDPRVVARAGTGCGTRRVAGRRRRCGGPRGRRPSRTRPCRSRAPRRGSRRARCARTPRVGAADRRSGARLPCAPSRLDGGLEAAVARLEDAPLLGDERVEVVGRDQLVLRPVDEPDEAAERPVRSRVVDERRASARMSRSSRTWPTPSSTSGRAGSPASAAFSVRIRWQKLWKLLTGMRARPRRRRVASSRSRSSARRLHVVGQDEDLLGQQVVVRRPADAGPARR